MNVEEVRQYSSPVLKSNMFLICSGPEALVIDPHISDEALALLKGQGVKRILILLTHEHYDHTSGLPWLAGNMKSEVVCQEATARSLRTGKNNRPLVLASQCINSTDREIWRACINSLPSGYTYEADSVFETEKLLCWQGHRIRMIHTPGHSPGSCCIELDEELVVTGDSFIRHTPVITRFPGGSSEAYLRETVPYLQRIREGSMILPGHGETFVFQKSELQACLAEE